MAKKHSAVTKSHRMSDVLSQIGPKVLIVGGPDVHKRIGLMKALEDEFQFSAAGSKIELAGRFSQANLPYFYYPLVRGSTPWADLRAARALQRLYRLYDPDVVHTFATKPSVWGRIAAWAAAVPVVIGTIPGRGSLYTSDDLKHRVNRVIYERLQQIACSCADLTVFQNREDEKYFHDAGLVRPERSRLILGSGVRTDVYNSTEVPQTTIEQFRAEVGIARDEVVVTMISRLIRSKGVLEFAEAAKAMRKERKYLRFLLVGPRDERSTDRLGERELDKLSKAVSWIGERRDVPVILAASDIFVLPTYYFEGIPRVLLEAAAMRVPLIASDVPGCTEIVHPGRNGFLIPPRDVPRLVDAISTLVERPALRRRFGEEGRKLAVEKFELEVVARQTRSIYRSLLSERSAKELGAKHGSPSTHRKGSLRPARRSVRQETGTGAKQ